MTRTLSLIRHAKSSWKHVDLDDADRPLNKRGMRDAPVMAERYARSHRPDLFLSSFATRALATARVFAGYQDYPVEQIRMRDDIYEAGPQQLLDILLNLDDSFSHVALFGHNPGLTLLCNGLCDAGIENIPTSGFVVIAFGIESWSDLAAGGRIAAGELVEFDYPKRGISV